MMKYIDFFIDQQIEENSNAFYEARMLVVIIFCYLWVMTAFAIFYGFISTTSVTEKEIILGLTFGLTLGLFTMLAMIKLFGFIKLCGEAIIATTCIATVFIVYFTDGPINSPFTLLAFVPAFLSFCLRGLKPGIIWSACINHILVNGVMKRA